MSSLNAFYLLFGIKGLFFGAYYPLWPNLLLQLGFGTSEIAKVFGIQTAVNLVFNIPSGILSDRVGHKRVSLLGILLIVAGVLVPAFRGISLNTILVGTALVALGDTFAAGALQAWLKDVQERGNGFSVTTHTILSRDQFERVGMIAGAFILIPLIVWVSKTGLWSEERLPWLILGGAGLVFFSWAALIKSAPVEIHSERKRLSFDSFKIPELRWLFLSCLMYGFANAVLGTVFWPKVNTLVAAGLSVASVQGVLSLTRITGITLWKKSGIMHKWWSVILSLLIASLFLAVFGVAQVSWVAIVSWLLLVVGLSLHAGALEFSILKFSSFDKATVLSTAAAVQGVGTYLSARVIEGVTKQEGNLGVVCVAGAVCLLLAALSILPAVRSR